MSFLPRCMGTTIGSYPFKDPAAVTQKLFEKLPHIPNWAQLPNYSFRESMYIQYSEGMPCVVIDADHGKMHFDTTGDIYAKLDVFYEKFVGKDLDYFGISEPYSAGLYNYLRRLPERDMSGVQYLKGQVTGPVSIGLTVTDQDKKSILYNESLVDSIVKSCAMKAAWQITQFKKYCPNIIIFIDEPYLSSFGSAFISLTREQVIEYVNEVVDTIHEYGGLAGVHCCGNTDWSILMDTKTDIINFDAYEYFQGLTLYPEQLRAFYARDGVLAWGMIPSTTKIQNESGDSILALFEKELQVLSQKGFDKQLVLDRCLVTPSCGMGTLSDALAYKVLDVVNDVSTKLRKTYYNA